MDFNLKHWRNQQYESENQHQHSAKIPKLLSNNLLHETNPQYQKPELPSSGSALPLFVPQLQPNNKISSHLSSSSHPFPDHSTPTPTPSTTSRLPKMGSGYFSMAQWQELELQALIFRYMLAGAAVPAELLQPIKKSISGLLTTPHYFQHQHQQHYPHPLHQYYPHCHPASAALIQTGYWGRAAMDPEPGRCRRTDGKKWRCSRDVVVGQKYCERHMHRGRNRSRKPVEIPTHAAGKVSGAAAGAGGGGGGGGGGVVSSGNPITGGGTHFALAGPTSSASAASIDLMRLSRSSSDVKRENKHIFKSNDGEKSDGHVLRHFFDDWPRSVQEPDNVGITNNSTTGSMNSSTSLSISMPGNLSSDVSLKLSTGNGEVPGHAETRAHSNRQSGWTAGWNSSPMGGPLAEALRSSNSNSSPTSVLHQLPRGSASETPRRDRSSMNSSHFKCLESGLILFCQFFLWLVV